MPDQSIKKPSYRVNRGGSWYYSASALRASNRDRNDPSYRYGNLGFRLVEEVTDADDDHAKKQASVRVIRGGGWRYPASSLSASLRYGLGPSLRNHYLGFRLVEEMQDED